METKELRTTELVHELDKDTRNMLAKLLYGRMLRDIAIDRIFSYRELEHGIECALPENVNKDYETKHIMHNVLRLFLLDGQITKLKFEPDFLDYTMYKEGCYNLRFNVFKRNERFIGKVLNKDGLVYGTFSYDFGTALYYIYKYIIEWKERESI